MSKDSNSQPSFYFVEIPIFTFQLIVSFVNYNYDVREVVKDIPSLRTINNCNPKLLYCSKNIKILIEKNI